MRNNAKASKHRVVTIAAMTVAGLTLSHAMGQNIIQNGGFEITGGTSAGGVVANWNVFEGPDPSEQTTVDTMHPHTGTNDLLMTNTNANGYGLYVYQDTPAGSVTPGTVYTFNFYAAGQTSNGGVCIYDVSWGNSNGIIQNTGGQVFFPNSTTYSAYPTGTNTYTAPAGATYAEIAFTAATGAVTNSVSQLQLDDVSFTAPVAVAGTSTWASSGAGDWNTASNWTNGVPNAVGAEADLLSALTANHTVYTDIPITLGTLNINNSNTYVIAGAGSLTMQASSGSAAIIVQAGTQKINLPLIIASNTNLNVSSGATLLVSDPVTINAGQTLNSIGTGTVTYQSTITVGPAGAFSIGNSTAAHSLSLQGNSTSTLTGSTGTRKLLQLDSLTLDPASALNLTNNDLIIHGGNLANVTSLLKTAYNNGAWSGPGIRSSAAAANVAHVTALGVNQASIAGTFDGAKVNAGDVLVRYTYYGDTNLDGKVDGSDYSRIDSGFLTQAGGWANGDLNYDGTVNGSDYTLIDNAFNTQGSPIVSAASQLADPAARISTISAVPEPGAIGLLAVGTAALLRRRMIAK